MKSRLLAAGIHFMASALVISFFLLLVYFVWYPSPFYYVHSTFDVVRILVAVDLVLGPLITLIIFNVRKPRAELVRDMSMIVILQLVALGWGAHITYKMRPIFAVLQDRIIYSVIKEDFDHDKLAQNISIPTIFEKPELLYIEQLTPEEIVQHVKNMFVEGSRDVMFQAGRYKLLSEHLDEALNESLNKSVLLSNESYKSIIDEFIEKHGGEISDYAFYPIEYENFKATVAVKQNDFQMVGLINQVLSDKSAARK